ncbi:hypothetical protein [Halalkalicoccus subterraneus]|uniref:hypothetical protein n=1 Tax=Halalkalicoccus subterraneus TaxID=2675002 RepID=UPI000EFAC586|nr:hypothetical protein [Halalkalicoccus subterraneus]
MLDSPPARVLAVITLCCVLGALFVGYGATTADPTRNDYPNERLLIEDPDDAIGQQVELSGAVVAVDPVVIAVENPTGDPLELRVTNVNEPVAEGEELRVFGTVESDTSIAAQRTLVREPWESSYMYVVSLLGGTWTLVRFIRGWRIDTDEWAFVQRKTPLGLRGWN